MLEYEKSSELDAFIAEVRDRIHPLLGDVSIEGMLVSKTDMTVPMFKDGFRVLAQIRVTPRRLCAYGMPMVTIDVEELFWLDASEEVRTALIDHELCHLGQPDEDKNGNIKLHLVPHDYVLTGFKDVVARHGVNAIETIEIAIHEETFGPLFDKKLMAATKLRAVGGKHHVKKEAVPIGFGAPGKEASEIAASGESNG